MCAEVSVPRFDSDNQSEPHTNSETLKYDPPCPVCGNRMYHAGWLYFGPNFSEYIGPAVLTCIDGGCSGALIAVVSEEHLVSRTEAQRSADAGGAE